MLCPRIFMKRKSPFEPTVFERLKTRSDAKLGLLRKYKKQEAYYNFSVPEKHTVRYFDVVREFRLPSLVYLSPAERTLELLKGHRLIKVQT